MNEEKKFSFVLPTRIEFGRGCLSKLPGVLEDLQVKNVLLVTDPGVRKAGILGEVEKHLEGGGIGFEIFDDVEANPKDKNIESGARVLARMKADAIVAVGGGSPIDCAKAMAVVGSLGGKARDYEGRGNVSARITPVVAVPTTAGTGSEVTFSAVITDTEESFKFSIRDTAIAPRVALADPLLTASMPASLTASTGMDALTHAIEGYTALVSEPIADACALEAVSYISRNIRRAVQDGSDETARSGMLVGSLLAGIAFSHSDVASVHCIAEALGGMYDAPHGACNAIVLPAVMEYNLEWCTQGYAQIAKAMGIAFDENEEGAKAAVDEVKRMARDVGLPDFRSLGVQEKDLQEIAEKSVRNGSNSSNPRPMEITDYLNVLEVLMQG
ncbi:MAG: iron-containing alcohol dehydrogenase [Thermovirgaceae bacterium]